MHSPEYIQLISEAASSLNIEVKLLTGNWTIQLKKNGIIKFIVGYTFPMNDAACYKTVRNRNVCSDILSSNKIPNVPHQIVFSPSILKQRKNKTGNFEILHKYITENKYPFLVKKNNSSKGQGVFLVNSEPELEYVLAKVYLTDDTLCLSPMRTNIREYRNIILDGECILSYEKQIPFLIGDCKSTVIELLSKFIKRNNKTILNPENLFDYSLIKRFSEIPKMEEKIYIQWKHNRFAGINYELVQNSEMESLAVNAAKAVNAKFVSVDIIDSEMYGMEVLEINASVSIYSIFLYSTSVNYGKVMGVYQAALQKIFD